jgi:hypothetical protein
MQTGIYHKSFIVTAPDPLSAAEEVPERLWQAIYGTSSHPMERVVCSKAG